MRTLLRYVRFMARAVRPAIFLHHVITQELGQFALKFGQKFRGSRGACKLIRKGYKKLAFYDKYLALLRNGTRHSHIVAIEDK